MTEDPKALWQQQPSERNEMDIESLRAGVRAQLARVRRARALLVLVTLVGASVAVYQAASAPTTLLRLGEGLLAGGFLFFLPLGWRRLAVASPDTAEACVAFLRNCLVRRRKAVRGGWIVAAAPLLPGLGVSLIALAVASGQEWLQLAPIAALLFLWLAIMVVMQIKEAAKVNIEIAQLDRQGRG